MTFVQADFSVELGADDPTLELPWTSADPHVQYYDVKSHPELISQIAEVQENESLGDFLVAMNSPLSFVQTAKCDTWTSRQMDVDDEMFAAAMKYESYIDLVPNGEGPRYSFAEIEDLAKKMAALLQRAPEIPAAAEFVVRRCYYHVEGEAAPRQGFYFTFYLSGYGDSEQEAQQRWSIALRLVGNALLQLSAAESSRARQ